MSKMNLQKLREICYLDERGDPNMKIILPPNDPLNRVVITNRFENHTAQVHTISSRIGLEVSYRTDEDFTNFGHREIIDFNSKLAQAFLPRLNQILVEHGFHEKYLAKTTSVNRYRMVSAIPFSLSYHVGVRFSQQIYHACYTDGREMRRAVEYQAKLNKT